MALLLVALLFEVTLVVTVLAINFVENAVTLSMLSCHRKYDKTKNGMFMADEKN